jgi:hypothetical protein
LVNEKSNMGSRVNQSELRSLITELRVRGLPTAYIARAVGYDRRHIHRLLVSLGMPKQRGFASFREAIESLPDEICTRLLALIECRRSSSESH